MFVDATIFLFLNNTVDNVATHGFTGNNNLFNFSLNSINSIQNEPFQISPLTLEISRNSFNAVAGQYNLSTIIYVRMSECFVQAVPSSRCYPHLPAFQKVQTVVSKNLTISLFLFIFSICLEYEDDRYRVVSGTVVNFKENVFAQFSPSMLNFPGTKLIYVLL